MLSQLIAYYVNLLILQYRGKPKAEGQIALFTDKALMDLLPLDVQAAFDLDTAVGVQLDLLGRYQGVTRRGQTFTSTIILDDDDFRTLIKIAIIRNSSGSSLYDIQTLLNDFFADVLLVFDFQNMSMGYFFDEAIGSRELAEMFVVQDLLPKPMGVRLASLIYSNNIDNFFGFRTYSINTPNNSPFNSYDDYTTDTPWLQYSNAIAF